MDIDDKFNAMRLQQNICSNTKMVVKELENINYHINQIDNALMNIRELEYKMKTTDNRMAKAVVNRVVKVYREQFSNWKMFINEDLDEILRILQERNLN